MSGYDVRKVIAVGMGGIAKVMTPGIARQPWAEFVGIVDISDEALTQGQELLGLPDSALFKDLEDALGAAEADVAIINTPSEWHFQQCVSCIDAGLDVLVAKPITNDFDEAVRLVDHAEQADDDRQRKQHEEQVEELADVLLEAVLEELESERKSRLHRKIAVSYTHLTLPTSDLV